nr:hypothetical protein [Tanacetum cinerariifolium]
MSTLAEYIIVSDAENRPPMLDKPQYESWKIRMGLYMQGKDHGRMILKSVENGPMVWPNVTLEDGITVRPKTYEELSKLEKLHNICDLKAANIVLQGDDPIACLNKAMAFMSTIFSLRFPPTNNQLRSSSNPRNQATIQDGRIIIQKVQGRQGQNAVGFGFQGNSLGSRENSTGQAKNVKSYNCQGLGHMARQCTMPKRKRDATWFKKKVLLVQSQAERKMLDEEELAFLAYPECAMLDEEELAFLAYLDAYDSDCDEIPSAAAILMTNLSSCDLETVSESQNVVYLDVELTSDSNVIPYSQYLKESQQASVPNTDISAQQNSLIMLMFEQISDHATNWDSTNKENKLVNESLTAELDRYRERVKILEQRNNVDLSTRERFIDSKIDDLIRNRNTKVAAFETEIDTLKQKLSKTVIEKESLSSTVKSCKAEVKQKEDKSIDTKIDFDYKIKEL